MVSVSPDVDREGRIAGRRSVRLRYLTLEAVRAAEILRDVLPVRLGRLLAELYDGDVPDTPRESLALATEPDRGVPEAPEWLGTIKPITVLRTHPASGGETPPEKYLQGRSPEQLMPELDDEDEAERSRILELFSARVRNPLATMAQRFFGVGRSPGGEGAAVRSFRSVAAGWLLWGPRPRRPTHPADSCWD